MTINQRLFNGVFGCAVSLVMVLMVWVMLPTVGWAASNQALQQSATLVAPKPSYKISIYPQPDQRKRRIGYGMGGDPVTVLEQVGSNQGTLWHHIRFDNPPYADGWVQETFLKLPQPEAEPKQQISNQSDGNRYLGNQTVNSQDRPQPYGLQNSSQNSLQNSRQQPRR